MGVRSETQAASKPQNRAELVGRPVGASSWREASATGPRRPGTGTGPRGWGSQGHREELCGEQQGGSVMPRKPGGGAETHLGLLRQPPSCNSRVPEPVELTG